MEIYLVGGAVRDEIMGDKSKDLDYTVVLPPVEGDPFRAMVNRLKMMGYTIFLESPDFLTVRAQTPDKKETADFVLARKESGYTDGRRPDSVEVGTLMDDLARRDFTMNAIAKDADGSLIDPFNGAADIDARIIRAVGDPMERLTEDALRAVRAMRFGVTKAFGIQRDLRAAMESDEVIELIDTRISDERIREEVNKMLSYSTIVTISYFEKFPRLTAAMFGGSVSLEATMKTKGKGKR